jgi:ribosomal protein S27AE
MDQEPINRDPREKPCPICGQSDFSWGTTITRYAPPDEYLYFRPEGSTHEDGDISLYARMCNRCGNVQVFSTQ